MVVLPELVLLPELPEVTLLETTSSFWFLYHILAPVVARGEQCRRHGCDGQNGEFLQFFHMMFLRLPCDARTQAVFRKASISDREFGRL